jgi:hypothetical protein
MAGEVATAIAASTIDTIAGTPSTSSTVSTSANVSTASATLLAISQGLRRIQRRSSRLPSSNNNRPSATLIRRRAVSLVLASIAPNPAEPAIMPITP